VTSVGQAEPTVLTGPAVTVARPPSRPWGRLLSRLIFVSLLLAATVVFVYPLIWLVSASLKDGANVFDGRLVPDELRVENYVRLFEVAPVANWAVNSLLVSALAALLVTLSSGLVAYGFAWYRFPGREPLFWLVLATMMLPGAVTLIPTFLIWDRLGFNGSLVPLWAGNLFASAFYVFLLRQFFLRLPRELFEAARVDGAGHLRLWWSMAVPLAWPALVVVFVFELKAAWTDLVRPLMFLHDTATFTLPLGLKAIIDNPSIGGQREWELLAAAGVIVTVPMVIVFLFAQRAFVEGAATTGIKG
jgi:multiple sugar transport system permease protein